MTSASASAPRLVHVISSLGVGGAERLLVDFMASLRPQEHDAVTVIVMNGSDPVMLADLCKTGVRVLAWDRPRGSRDPRYLFRLMEDIGSGPVVVHAHNRGSKFWAMLVRLLRPKTRLVFTVHAMHIVEAYGAVHRAVHNRLVDCTVAISRAVAAECEASGLRNVVVVRNGVDLSRFRISPESEACRLEREPDRVPVIVTVARLVHAIKGQDVLIEAVARLKQRGMATRLRLIGSPSSDQPETPAYLRELVTRHGLEGDVTFVEGVADAAPEIRAADICAVPSRAEGFGLVILEAMASGVPVVASRLDGPAELIETGRTGYLAEPGNADDLADKIALLLSDPALASRMVRDARAVADTHDIAVMRDAYLDLYRRLAR
ncbi:glycosyltransferase family 4 protein [Hyphomicrobium sp.]|uniref:glycosyltransferase family 4 protein n=1 Tax=Hyphomicrobium sp. TaxID=82 RepID=UPI003F6F6D8B